MDQFAEVPVVAWAVAAGVAFLLFLLFVRWAAGWLRRTWQVHSVPARVVTKRSATYGQMSSSSPGHVYTSYFATFEIASGDRMEFHLHDSAYGLLVEGDQGTLTYKGTRWHGFERKGTGKGAGRRRVSRSRQV
jgi:hypothetical protein